MCAFSISLNLQKLLFQHPDTMPFFARPLQLECHSIQERFQAAAIQAQTSCKRRKEPEKAFPKLGYGKLSCLGRFFPEIVLISVKQFISTLYY